MKPPPKSAAMKTIAGLVELLNDPGITDRARLGSWNISTRRSKYSSSTCAPGSQSRDHGAAIRQGYEVGCLTHRSTLTPIPKVLIYPDLVPP
jgi:hypothetical protein